MCINIIICVCVYNIMIMRKKNYDHNYTSNILANSYYHGSIGEIRSLEKEKKNTNLTFEVF
jgi:hypothetical protein